MVNTSDDGMQYSNNRAKQTHPLTRNHTTLEATSQLTDGTFSLSWQLTTPGRPLNHTSQLATVPLHDQLGGLGTYCQSWADGPHTRLIACRQTAGVQQDPSLQSRQRAVNEIAQSQTNEAMKGGLVTLESHTELVRTTKEILYEHTHYTSQTNATLSTIWP